MTRLGPPRPQDAEAVAALIAVRDVTDFGAPDFTLADLRDEWSHREFDLAADALVARDASDVIVGYAAVAAWGARLAISPDAEDDAIGAGLLQWAERRQRETGAYRLRCRSRGSIRPGCTRWAQTRAA